MYGNATGGRALIGIWHRAAAAPPRCGTRNRPGHGPNTLRETYKPEQMRSSRRPSPHCIPLASRSVYMRQPADRNYFSKQPTSQHNRNNMAAATGAPQLSGGRRPPTFANFPSTNGHRKHGDDFPTRVLDRRLSDIGDSNEISRRKVEHLEGLFRRIGGAIPSRGPARQQLP